MPSPLTFLKSLTHHNEESTATPRKGILRRSPAKLKKATIRHPPVDKGQHAEPEKNDTDGRVQEVDLKFGLWFSSFSPLYRMMESLRCHSILQSQMVQWMAGGIFLHHTE